LQKLSQRPSFAPPPPSDHAMTPEQSKCGLVFVPTRFRQPLIGVVGVIFLTVTLVKGLVVSFPAKWQRKPTGRVSKNFPLLAISEAISHSECSPLTNLLQSYNLANRLQVLAVSPKELASQCVLAEVHICQKMELCQIVAINAAMTPSISDPRRITLEVKQLQQLPDSVSEPRVLTVDLGQVTTIWTTNNSQDDLGQFHEPSWMDNQVNRFPVGAIETILDNFYRSRVGTSRSLDNTGITKKEIAKLVAEFVGDDEEERSHAEQIVRQVLKAGKGSSRLVDSALLARDYLYASNTADKPRIPPTTLKRAVAAHVLAVDAELGGRFKRQPCLLVHASAGWEQNGVVESIAFINGGWLVVDQSVRAGSEATKFARRAAAVAAATCPHQDNNNQQTPPSRPQWTIADERITQRLECLAMGEALSANSSDHPMDDVTSKSLELHVRQALQSLNAPLTPEGARQLLVQMGRWSDQAKAGDRAWSPVILQAAREYAKYRQSKNSQERVPEGVMDLTKLPFVCVDAPRTTFRDDAICIRPRRVTEPSGKTGLSSHACPWEILIAITDVSDIYMDQNSNMQEEESQVSVYRELLRDGAANRGVSRYDLPLGPLHLMPPVALAALAFDTGLPTTGSKNEKSRVHPAVVIWAWIDETTGKVMDAGIERAVIANPVALSYQQASDLLDGNVDTSNDLRLHRSRQVLAVVERTLIAWYQQRRQTSDAAQKREERLALKEFVSHHQQRQNRRDNYDEGFLRTRGHRLVDISLNLYSYVAKGMMRRSKAFLPQHAGSGQARDGRVATAPLRRYVDGMAQRQILSVACGHGGPPMSNAECIRVSQKATDSYNAISNIRSIRKGAPSIAFKNVSSLQKVAVRNLHLLGMAGSIIPAVTTGRGNEVVITGVGALAKCKGVNHTFKPGQKLQVQIHKIDVDSGNVSVTIVN
jgi:RNB domain